MNPKDLIIDNIIWDFLFYCKNSLCRVDDVITHHKYNLKQFFQYVKARKWIMCLTVADISCKDCTDYIAYYKTHPITYWFHEWQLPAHNTVCDKMKSIRAFFYRIKVMWWETFNYEMLPILKKERWEIDQMEKWEYDLLVQAPLIYEEKEIIWMRNHLLIKIPYKMWLRRSEILQCRFSHFHESNRQFIIRRKWWYKDPVFFTESLRSDVFEYENMMKEFTKNKPINNDFMFIWLDNKNYWKPLARKFINLLYQKYSNKLLEEWKTKRRLTCHMERHSFATNCVYAWLQPQITSSLMGHRNPATTQWYYRLNNDYLRWEFDKLENVNIPQKFM